MIHQTFPSSVDGTTKETIWQVNVLLDVTGLQRWKDYIPVQFDATFDNKNAYGENDIILVEQNSTGQAGLDFNNVFVEGTVRWSADENGYIPVAFFGT